MEFGEYAQQQDLGAAIADALAQMGGGAPQDQGGFSFGGPSMASDPGAGMGGFNPNDSFSRVGLELAGGGATPPPPPATSPSSTDFVTQLANAWGFDPAQLSTIMAPPSPVTHPFEQNGALPGGTVTRPMDMKERAGSPSTFTPPPAAQAPLAAPQAAEKQVLLPGQQARDLGSMAGAQARQGEIPAYDGGRIPHGWIRAADGGQAAWLLDPQNGGIAMQNKADADALAAQEEAARKAKAAPAAAVPTAQAGGGAGAGTPRGGAVAPPGTPPPPPGAPQVSATDPAQPAAMVGSAQQDLRALAASFVQTGRESDPAMGQIMYLTRLLSAPQVPASVMQEAQRVYKQFAGQAAQGDAIDRKASDQLLQEQLTGGVPQGLPQGQAYLNNEPPPPPEANPDGRYLPPSNAANIAAPDGAYVPPSRHDRAGDSHSDIYQAQIPTSYPNTGQDYIDLPYWVNGIPMSDPRRSENHLPPSVQR